MYAIRSYYAPGARKISGSVHGIVRIACDHMRQPAIEQRCREALRPLAESTKKRLPGHLKQAAGVYPSLEIGKALLQQSVPLRMRDNGDHAGAQQHLENLAGVLENQQVGELDEQVIVMIDCSYNFV